MKKYSILIYGLGGVSGVLSSLFSDDVSYTYYSPSENKFKNKNIIITHKYSKNEKKYISFTNNKKEKYDLIICGVKANFIYGFREFLLQQKLESNTVLMIQNGMGWEINLPNFKWFQAISTFNCNRKDNNIYWNTKGNLLLDAKFLINYHLLFNPKYLSNKVIIPIDNIEEIRVRKLWLNIVNGYLAMKKLSLYDAMVNSSTRKEVKILLFEVKEIIDQNHIKTQPLNSLDPIDLINDNYNIEELPKSYNSTLQSLEKNEKTEIYYLINYFTKFKQFKETNYLYKIYSYFKEIGEL